MNPPQTFSEAELDRLEELLDSPVFNDEAMQLDELQALICAVVSGPQTVPPDVWLSAALGASPAYETELQAGEVLDLVMRFHNDIAATLLQGDDWELILYPFADDPEDLDYATWADAYIYGSQLGSDWYQSAGEHAEDLSEMLQPFFLLNGMLKEDAEHHHERWMSPAEEQLAIERAQENLPELVSAIYDFWRARQPAGETGAPRPAEPGQDEGCPCGSGRNYKQCCGSPERLH